MMTEKNEPTGKRAYFLPPFFAGFFFLGAFFLAAMLLIHPLS
jgi:hypothetical protein